MRPIKDRTAIAFLLGFGLCYLVGAALTFNMLTTLRYPLNDALPRAALWWWTVHVGNGMLDSQLQKYPFRITIP